MGFWSGLKSIGKFALPIGAAIAAPFTMGGSLAATGAIGGASTGAKLLSGLTGAASTLGGIGKVSGEAAQAAALGRQQEYANNLKRDELLYNAYQNDLQNRTTMPKTFAKQAVVGDVMGTYNPGDYLKNLFSSNNVADTMKSWTSAPKYQLTDTTKKAYESLSKQAMENLLNPPKAPTFSEMPKASGWEKALGGVSLGSNLLASAGGYFDPKRYANTAGSGGGQSQAPSSTAPPQFSFYTPPPKKNPWDVRFE